MLFQPVLVLLKGFTILFKILKAPSSFVKYALEITFMMISYKRYFKYSASYSFLDKCVFYGVIWGYFDLIKRPLKLMPRP